MFCLDMTILVPRTIRAIVNPIKLMIPTAPQKLMGAGCDPWAKAFLLRKSVLFCGEREGEGAEKEGEIPMGGEALGAGGGGCEDGVAELGELEGAGTREAGERGRGAG